MRITSAGLISGPLLLVGAFYFGLVPLVHGAAGPTPQVAEHLGAALKFAREAREAITGGHSEACTAAIKQAKQSCKEVVGDLADRPARDDTLGWPMEQTMKALKDPRALCEKGNEAEGAKTLDEVTARLERLLADVTR